MSHCEAHATALSALADGELDTIDLLPAIDHLADCASCREFWRDVRLLDAALAEREAAAEVAAPPEVLWQRIVAARSPAAATAVRRRAWLPWAAAVAAALIAGVLLGQAWVRPFRPAVADGALEVELYGDADRMTDERFVELTAELLGAGRRYHEKMLEVMSAVTRSTDGRESSPEETRAVREDGWRPTSADDRSGETARGSRL